MRDPFRSGGRSRNWIAGALLALAWGCDPGPAPEGGSPPPARPMTSDTGAVTGRGVPAGAIRTVLLVVTGFDDEGILTEVLTTDPPGIYAVGDTLWAPAVAVVAAVTRSPAPEAAVVGGRLVLDGAATPIPARVHDGVAYAPAASVALRHRAILYLHPPPEPGVRQRSGTLWPHPKLCELWDRGHREGAAARAASAAGLIDACPGGA